MVAGEIHLKIYDIRTDVEAREQGLTQRQADVLDLQVTHGRLIMGQLATHFPDINRRTVQRDMKVLTDKDLARKIGSEPTDPNLFYEAATSSDTKL